MGAESLGPPGRGVRALSIARGQQAAAEPRFRSPRRQAMNGLLRTLVALAAFATAAAQAQDIRLYAFSSGALTIGRGILQNLAPVDPPIQIPVGFFLVRHPRGNVLFDTGNNDRLINDPKYWPDALQSLKPAMTPDVAIDVQLRKAGVSPDDITYVVVSHMHLDHGGNVGKFPKSTLVVQRDE